jgi:hypothetical protein
VVSSTGFTTQSSESNCLFESEETFLVTEYYNGKFRLNRNRHPPPHMHKTVSKILIGEKTGGTFV